MEEIKKYSDMKAYLENSLRVSRHYNWKGEELHYLKVIEEFEESCKEKLIFLV